MRSGGKSVGSTAGASAGLVEPSEIPPIAKKGAWLAIGRIADQGAIGLIGLILAARVSVNGFAPFAVLLVGYSVSATLGDLGLGHEILRLGSGHTGDQRMLRRVRLVAVGCILGAAAAFAVNAYLVGWILALWALNSETTLRQLSAMLGNHHRRIGVAQVAAAVCLVAAVAPFGPSLHVLGVALSLRTVVEMFSLPSPSQWFSDRPTMALSPLPVVASHATAYGTRNVDFFVAGPLLGAAAFGLYVFAFRLANAAFAPLGALTTRLGIAELANEGEQLARRYRRSVLLLLAAGATMAVVTGCASYLLPAVIGEQWEPAVAIIVVLVVALPWRFIDGLIGPILYVSDNHDLAFRVEIGRLLITLVAVLAAAPAGALALALANTIATVTTVWAGHRLGATRAHVATPKGFDVLAAVSVLLAVGLWLVYR